MGRYAGWQALDVVEECVVDIYIFADLIIIVLQALFQGSKIKLVKNNMLYDVVWL